LRGEKIEVWDNCKPGGAGWVDLGENSPLLLTMGVRVKPKPSELWAIFDGEGYRCCFDVKERAAGYIAGIASMRVVHMREVPDGES